MGLLTAPGKTGVEPCKWMDHGHQSGAEEVRPEALLETYTPTGVAGAGTDGPELSRNGGYGCMDRGVRGPR